MQTPQFLWSYIRPFRYVTGRVSNGLGRAAWPGGVRPMAHPGPGLGISKARGPACGPSSWAGWTGLGKN